MDENEEQPTHEEVTDLIEDTQVPIELSELQLSYDTELEFRIPLAIEHWKNVIAIQDVLRGNKSQRPDSQQYKQLQDEDKTSRTILAIIRDRYRPAFDEARRQIEDEAKRVKENRANKKKVT